MVSWMLSPSAVGVLLATFAAGSVDFLADDPRVVRLEHRRHLAIWRVLASSGKSLLGRDERRMIVCGLYRTHGQLQPCHGNTRPAGQVDLHIEAAGVRDGESDRSRGDVSIHIVRNR